MSLMSGVMKSLPTLSFSSTISHFLSLLQSVTLLACSLDASPSMQLLAQTVKRLSTMRETWVPSLDQEDLLEKEMAIHSSTIAWKSHGQKSLVGYSPWGRKESDTTERLHFPFKILRLKTLGFPGSTKKQTNNQTKKTCL